MSGGKRLGAREVFHDGPFRVVEERWRHPDGSEVVYRSVKSPSFSVVVGVTDEGEIPFLRNFHPSPGLRLLELPGGQI